jgi:hypothetical protein
MRDGRRRRPGPFDGLGREFFYDTCEREPSGTDPHQTSRRRARRRTTNNCETSGSRTHESGTNGCQISGFRASGCRSHGSQRSMSGTQGCTPSRSGITVPEMRGWRPTESGTRSCMIGYGKSPTIPGLISHRHQPLHRTSPYALPMAGRFTSRRDKPRSEKMLGTERATRSAFLTEWISGLE